MTNTPDNEWHDYYRKFSYFSSELIRPGSHPLILKHSSPSDKAIVLVHGLTDSPHYMTALGRHFHQELGYDVYLPLLHCHGLKDPGGMEDVSLDEWKKNVSFAIETAKAGSSNISIGGLSTGGVLSLFSTLINGNINGNTYLFSAAIDLGGHIWGDIMETLLRTFLVDILDSSKPLIGEHPYRYCRMDLDGARQLANLLKELNELLKNYSSQETIIEKRIFAAHSEFDSTAGIRGIERLQKLVDEENFDFYRIAKSEKVDHPSLVLDRDIHSTDRPDKVLEPANPLFNEMIQELTAFEQSTP